MKGNDTATTSTFGISCSDSLLYIVYGLSAPSSTRRLPATTLMSEGHLHRQYPGEQLVVVIIVMAVQIGIKDE